MSATSRFFHNVRSVLRGQRPLDDNFNQTPVSTVRDAVSAAGQAFGSTEDPDKRPTKKIEPWQLAEHAPGG